MVARLHHRARHEASSSPLDYVCLGLLVTLLALFSLSSHFSLPSLTPLALSTLAIPHFSELNPAT